MCQSLTFILQSDIVEPHQWEQSVTVDLKPLPQQSQRREVFGRSVQSAQGGCRSDKELCGEAPKSLLYHRLTQHAEKVAQKLEGWREWRSKRDGDSDRNTCKEMKNTNTVERISPPPKQLSQFI